jgi:hypothetical protein
VLSFPNVLSERGKTLDSELCRSEGNEVKLMLTGVCGGGHVCRASVEKDETASPKVGEGLGEVHTMLDSVRNLNFLDHPGRRWTNRKEEYVL